MSDHTRQRFAIEDLARRRAKRALAMDAHWKQVRGIGKPTPSVRTLLRTAASMAFFLSFILCNQTDHATIAALVWVMALTAAALTVGLMLTWRPALLRAPYPGWAAFPMTRETGRGRPTRPGACSSQPIGW